MTATAPTCPYCNRTSELVTGDVLYPHRDDLFGLRFWSCKPCDAYVGCHRQGLGYEGNEPLGRLANRDLRRLKSIVHTVFDVIWKKNVLTRTEAYMWLSSKMQLPPEQTHIGMFDETQCQAAIRHSQSLLADKGINSP